MRAYAPAVQPFAPKFRRKAKGGAKGSTDRLEKSGTAKFRKGGCKRGGLWPSHPCWAKSCLKFFEIYEISRRKSMDSRGFLSENRRFPDPFNALPPPSASDSGLPVPALRAVGRAIAKSPYAQFFQTLAFLRLRPSRSPGQARDRAFAVRSRRERNPTLRLPRTRRGPDGK